MTAAHQQQECLVEKYASGFAWLDGSCLVLHYHSACIIQQSIMLMRSFLLTKEDCLFVFPAPLHRSWPMSASWCVRSHHSLRSCWPQARPTPGRAGPSCLTSKRPNSCLLRPALHVIPMTSVNGSALVLRADPNTSRHVGQVDLSHWHLIKLPACSVGNYNTMSSSVGRRLGGLCKRSPRDTRGKHKYIISKEIKASWETKHCWSCYSLLFYFLDSDSVFARVKRRVETSNEGLGKNTWLHQLRIQIL